VLNIGLCDDEPKELEFLLGLVEDYGRQKGLSFEIHSFHRGEELLSAIIGGISLDIVLLDIYMGTSNGVSVARKIREFDKTCGIIFATNSPDHAIEGYGVRAIQYLLKPITAADLASALDRATENALQKDAKCVKISNRQGNYKIAIKDIVYAESNARVITVHKRDGETLSFYDRLDNFARACGDERFLRCHKSFLVNLDYVHAIVNNGAILETGEEIRISMSVSDAKELFAAHAAKSIM
jgi:two-component system, LytTR family, response regulator LytT